jgi:hypothetical protein
MMGAAEYGTARRGVDASMGIAGKTGSCISKGSWVGLFASVAPIEMPKYSVVVITRGERERGKYAAAVAGQIYKALSSRIVRTDRNLAQTEFKLQPKFGSGSQVTAAVADESDDDESPDTLLAADGADGSVNSKTSRELHDIAEPVVIQRQTPKKLVTRTGSSKPVFPPVIITYDRDGKTTKP